MKKCFIVKSLLLSLPTLIMLNFIVKYKTLMGRLVIEVRDTMHCPRAIAKERWELEEYYSDGEVLRRSNECLETDFKVSSGEPLKTKLAFSILVHHNAGILAEQLRLIFHPSHAYCIFVDEKATDTFKKTVNATVECYKSRNPGATIFIGTAQHESHYPN